MIIFIINNVGIFLIFSVFIFFCCSIKGFLHVGWFALLYVEIVNYLPVLFKEPSACCLMLKWGGSRFSQIVQFYIVFSLLDRQIFFCWNSGFYCVLHCFRKVQSLFCFPPACAADVQCIKIDYFFCCLAFAVFLSDSAVHIFSFACFPPACHDDLWSSRVIFSLPFLFCLIFLRNNEYY